MDFTGLKSFDFVFATQKFLIVVVLKVDHVSVFSLTGSYLLTRGYLVGIKKATNKCASINYRKLREQIKSSVFSFFDTIQQKCKGKICN